MIDNRAARQFAALALMFKDDPKGVARCIEYSRKAGLSVPPGVSARRGDPVKYRANEMAALAAAVLTGLLERRLTLTPREGAESRGTAFGEFLDL